MFRKNGLILIILYYGKKLLMHKFLFVLLIAFTQNTYAWIDIDCSKINVSFVNNNFETYRCQRNVNGAVFSEFLLADNFQGSPLQSLYVQHDYFLDHNSKWSSNWAIQALKRQSIEQEIRDWGIGNIVHIDNKETKLNGFNGVYFKKFETSLGKGFLVTNQLRNHIWALGYLIESQNANVNEDLVIDLYSSIDVKGAKKASFVITNNTNNTKSFNNSSSESFIDFCKRSNLGNLSKDVARLCLEKMN